MLDRMSDPSWMTDAPSLTDATASRPARVGVVLAGGRAQRMAGDKAGALLSGSTLLGRAVATVRAAGLEPRTCAREETVLPVEDATVWREFVGLVGGTGARAPTPHPLAGLAFALAYAKEPIVALPVDLPFLPPAVLAALAARTEPLVVLAQGGAPAALVLRADPRVAPALAAAARDGTPAMKTLLAAGAVLAELGDLVGAPGPDALFNVNGRDDLRRAQALLDAGRA